MSAENDEETQGSGFFLHHYEPSPYAEKIRAMFGLAGAPWNSVLSPPYPPRPNVDPLAGGYRRIPIGQIGADIFCDTALIATEVAELCGHPEFAPVIHDSHARALVERAEGDVFFAAITSASPLKLLTKLVLANGLRGTLDFVRDRTAMMKKASLRPPQGKEARDLFQAFLADLDSHLLAREGLEGEALTYADFSVYHPVWLGVSVSGPSILKPYSEVLQWMERMQGLGHGKRREARPEEAFSAAERHEPRPLPAELLEHDALHKRVTIAPADYGKDGVEGELVAVLADRVVLRREADRFGSLHVHFPRLGYDIVM